MPKISILMGIYNCADTLDEAIDSILNQTYTDWVMIMCDDGSADDTFETAQKYVDKYPGKFVLLKNEKNMGLNYTLNRCLSEADGEYIARMDGDDISLPNRFEKEVRLLDEHPEFALVSTPMIFFDEAGDWGATKLPEIPQLEDYIYRAPVHSHAPCMIRKEAFLKVGGYTVDKRLLRFEDFHLWYKLYGAGYRGYNIQEPLYKMRNDHKAFTRRTFSSRMRGTQVQYICFKLIGVPKKFYFYLPYKVCKDLAIALMPEGIYMKLYKRKYS